MNHSQISANWRISNSRITANACDFKPELPTFCFQRWCEARSIGDCQSVNFMKLPVFLVSFQIQWLFPYFFGQFSNFLTFPGFPGSVVTLFLPSILMKLMHALKIFCIKVFLIWEILLLHLSTWRVSHSLLLSKVQTMRMLTVGSTILKIQPLFFTCLTYKNCYLQNFVEW